MWRAIALASFVRLTGACASDSTSSGADLRSPLPADWDLVLLSTDSTQAYRLTSGVGNDRAPAWSRC